MALIWRGKLSYKMIHFGSKLIYSVSMKEWNEFQKIKRDRSIRRVNGNLLFDNSKGILSTKQALEFVCKKLGFDLSIQKFYYLVKLGAIKCSRHGASYLFKEPDLIEFCKSCLGNQTLEIKVVD